MLKAILVLPLAMLSACATLVDGASQTITVSTSPAGAVCRLDRMGATVGAIPITPGSVRIDKSRHDLSVTCGKEGYYIAKVTHSSDFNGVTFGNLVVGGLTGIIVDAASGANYTYPGEIRMELAASRPPGLPPTAFQPSPDRIQPTPVSTQSLRRVALMQTN